MLFILQLVNVSLLSQMIQDPGHIAALSKVNTLWLAIESPTTKSNLSFRQNSNLVLKNSMEELSIDEVKDYISKNKLIDKIK